MGYTFRPEGGGEEMPWRESSVMDERMRFVIRLKDGETMAALCREFGISRKTGYKIFERYQQCGMEGLSDRTRRLSGSPFSLKALNLRRGVVGCKGMFVQLASLLFSLRRCLQTRAALHAENLALRHQLLLLQRVHQNRRLRLRSCDRLVWVWLSRVWSNWRSALCIVKPETVIAWHRQGFRLYWKWKSRVRHGRPSVPTEIQNLIQKMSLANPRWGAPRIHGELQKLGIHLAQATVAKYMVRHRKPPSQTWRTFLQNHMKDMVSSDFFVVPTVFFRVFFVFVILSHDRRRPVHLAATEYPTAEWVAHQLLEAFPWDSAPLYLLRDRDGSYGERFHEAASWLDIREVLTARQSPWQNAYVERLIGSIR